MRERLTASSNKFVMAAVMVIVIALAAYKAWERFQTRSQGNSPSATSRSR